MTEKSRLKSLTVEGYKLFAKEKSIIFKPLTLLAGANSSGKSSIMQPLLLLKQTIESPYDPGTLLLNGSNVHFSSFEQLLSKKISKDNKNQFYLQMKAENKKQFKIIYEKYKKDIKIKEMSFYDIKNKKEITINENMKYEEEITNEDYSSCKEFLEWQIFQDRCFLALQLIDNAPTPILYEDRTQNAFWEKLLLNIIHIPGLRGNPERNYKISAVKDIFPGTFENYVASVINNWQTNKDGRLKKLCAYLEKLGLTWKVEARQLNDTQVELMVGRLPGKGKSGVKDVVNISDVGFGVSQVMPVIVALLVAMEGQLVYVEQPELHLHPKAQVAMAEIIADASKRGVIVVIETHSPILLLGIQTLIAEKKFAPELVKFHWFTREKDGSSKITSVDPDENGAYGDWPEDFGDIELKLESRYLDASENWDE